MKVDAAEWRQTQNLWAEDLPEGDDHDQVGTQLSELLGRRGPAKRGRLENGQPKSQRGLLDRRRGRDPPPARRPIRLSDDRDDRFARANQRLQARHGDGWGTHKDDAARVGAARVWRGRP
jgi:hypothetical protein